MRGLLESRAAIVTEMRQLNEAAGDGDLNSEQRSRWDALRAELAAVDQKIERRNLLDDAERRVHGQNVGGTGDTRLDAEVARVGILDAIRALLGGTDADAGRARAVSAELERRSGRKAEGLFWSMRGSSIEHRVTTSTLPADGPGGNLIPTNYRPDLFVDRLRNSTAVRSLGARVLTGLAGNLAIPKRTTSVAAGWVAENAPLPTNDQKFASITLTPKHAGCITEFSRNMIQQASPDVEALARDDMELVLAETLDAAAIAGTGANNQPRGILNTSGIGSIGLGTNGGFPSYTAINDLIGEVALANAETGRLGFLANMATRTQLNRLMDTTGRPLGLDTLFQGIPRIFTNLVPGNLAKGTGTNLSALIYGNWSDLLIGLWSELDILVNPYESTAYSKGNVQVRAMMTCDIAVRHPESFAAITDIVTTETQG